MYSSEYEEQSSSNKSSGGFYQNNRLLIWIFIAIILIAIVIVIIKKNSDSTSNKSNVNRYSISIYPENDITLSPGNTSKLIAIVKENSKAKVVWSSSDESVATVSDGTVTAIKYGNAVIMASYTHTDNRNYTAKKEITVADGNKNVTLSDISIKDGSLVIPTNGTYNITFVPVPNDAYIFAKTITSSNEGVVNVNDNNIVQAVGEGEADITININNGAIVRTLKTYVSKDYTISEIIPNPTKLVLNKEMSTIKVGASAKINYSVEPKEADKAIINWTSSDESVLLVDKNGIVEGKKEGKATVKIESLNGIVDTLEIEVIPDVIVATDILVPNDLYLETGMVESIIPMMVPENAIDTLTCTSNNPAIVSVNNTGVSCNITALATGTAVITVKANNANITKTVNVTVSKPSGGSSGGGCGSYGSECNNSNKTCAPGKYCSCGKCVSCPQGYYCANNKKTACPAGKSSSPNSSSYQDCSACSKGSYLSNGKCTACPTGYTTSSSGSTDKSACNVCASGYYKEGNTCKSCPSGAYCVNGIKYTSIGTCVNGTKLANGQYCNVPSDKECNGGTGYATVKIICNHATCSAITCRDRVN